VVKKALYDVIVADAGVTAQLATYNELPAVFTSRIIPENCKYPAVHITQVSSAPWGCRDKRGSEIMVDVDVYDDKDRSDKALNELAHDIWELLNRVTLAPSGYDPVLCEADAPLQLADDEGFPGYVIRCRIVVLES
jgi:hypothetical protein